jgi:hypothetical protein
MTSIASDLAVLLASPSLAPEAFEHEVGTSNGEELCILDQKIGRGPLYRLRRLLRFGRCAKNALTAKGICALSIKVRAI